MFKHLHLFNSYHHLHYASKGVSSYSARPFCDTGPIHYAKHRFDIKMSWTFCVNFVGTSDEICYRQNEVLADISGSLSGFLTVPIARSWHRYPACRFIRRSRSPENQGALHSKHTFQVTDRYCSTTCPTTVYWTMLLSLTSGSVADPTSSNLSGIRPFFNVLVIKVAPLAVILESATMLDYLTYHQDDGRPIHLL
ncbi:uncharacterized protein ARMOST_02142 [Armillaria ostoyae]|uniref:Uncharacterized protein n=1 Tax=Armillaria ostoyae TaxID=47428 RepID=A0A284QQW5_ARMOS|nr:uncharacterized protein ARMOST_02142 [Armillaria ostoyae]